MLVHKIVTCSCRVGLGPKWIDKEIEVYMDDVDDETSESEILDMVLADAKATLWYRGYRPEYGNFRIGEIFNA